MTVHAPARSAAIASTVARAAETVVIIGMPARTAFARILPSSVFAPFLVGVLMMRLISPLAITSSTVGRAPSLSLCSAFVSTPRSARYAPVPRDV